MGQEITPELLHGNGFQSYIDDDETSWWYDDEWIIYFDSEIEEWFQTFCSEGNPIKTLEDFIELYERKTSKKWEAKPAITFPYQTLINWIFCENCIGRNDIEKPGFTRAPVSEGVVRLKYFCCENGGDSLWNRNL